MGLSLAVLEATSMRSLRWHSKVGIQYETVPDSPLPDASDDLYFLITHRVSLEGPKMFKTFRNKKEGCIKVVMRPTE
jgi:threonine dehydrogenase-like Zn-dependent dehydrogenase